MENCFDISIWQFEIATANWSYSQAKLGDMHR